MNLSLTGMTMDNTTKEERLMHLGSGKYGTGEGEENMLDDGLDALPGRLTVTFNTDTKKRSVKIVDQMDCTIMDHSDQLIPGTFDTVTMHAIVPRLQWRDFHNLAMVSHRWNQAIRSGEVHDARVRSHSTETLVVMQSGVNIFLVSTKNKYFYRLPKVPIPHLNLYDNKWQNLWSWVSLDGKIYVLGGLMDDDDRDCASREVYVMDLARQKKWKPCASMKAKRNDFACGVLDGNIYVFGGTSHKLIVQQAEVYDPKENIWSPISCEIWREHPSVATIGGEFIFCGGYREEENFWDVYNPRKDEWRRGPLFLKNFKGKTFFAQGKVHRISEAGIDVYNDQKSTWSHLHSVCNDMIVRGMPYYCRPALDPEDFEIQDIVAVDDEILVALCRRDLTNYGIVHRASLPTSYLFFRSEGLGTNQKEILWHKEDGYLPALDSRVSFLCTIQL